MSQPPELPPQDSDHHLVSLEVEYLFDSSKLTVEPYDVSGDEALTAVLDVSWVPDRIVPVLSDFTLRRQQQLAEELLDATLAEARHSAEHSVGTQDYQTALNPRTYGLGRAGLYLIVDNTK